MKIWERYFISETLKGVFFFLLAFGGLYVLIDYASHTGSFHHHHVRFSFSELALFYAGELIRRSDVMIPFAILVATVRTLSSLNIHNELVALLAAGVSMNKLMRPFLFVGLLGVMYLYFNEEILLPETMKSSRELGERHTVDQALKAETPSAHHLVLEDGSLLIFQNYDRATQRFFDTWWVRSIDEIWRIKYIDNQEYPEISMGRELEIFQRNREGALISTDVKSTVALSEMRFNPLRLLETVTQAEDLAISDLALKLFGRDSTQQTTSEKQSRLETALIRKLLLPWLALIVVIGSAPFCLIFTRNLNVFKIFAITLFGLVFFYLVINAGTTLADRQVFSPMVALFLPFAMMTTFLGIRWMRQV